MNLQKHEIWILLAIIQLIMIALNRAKAKWYILHLLLFMATFLFYFGTSLRFFAAFSFFTWWLFIFLEQLYPRNQYSMSSSENTKSASIYPIRAIALNITAAYISYTYLQGDLFSFNLHEAGLPFALQVLVLLLFSDFWLYWVHRSQHYFDFHWRFHKLHHASTELTFWTRDRTNLFEYLLLQHLPVIVLYYLSGCSPDARITAGVLLVIVGSAQHANLNFPKENLSFLNYIFATPNFHAVHHLLNGQNSNYSQYFPIWDILFKTYRKPEKSLSDFGVDDKRFCDLNLLEQHLEPFQTQKK